MIMMMMMMPKGVRAVMSSRIKWTEHILHLEIYRMSQEER
jgi:hypothetical protein